MKKFLLTGMALAMLAIPATASADVARCDATVAVNTTVTTAKFTVNQPKDAISQWGNVWKHDFTVIVLPDGSFSGTGDVTDNGGALTWTEQITGTFNTDRTRVSFNTVPNAGATFAVTDALMDGITVAPVTTTWTQNIVEFRITPPVITTDTTTTTGTESVKNHGQFVKAQGGGKVAAQACAGMPLVSTQGQITP